MTQRENLSRSHRRAASAPVRVLVSHVLSAAIMLALIVITGESPRVFIYAVFLNYFYRLLTLRGIIALDASGSVHWRRLARSLSRPPHPVQPSCPVTSGEGPHAKPAGFGAYLAVLAILASFTFFVVNVRDQEIVPPLRVIVDEVLHGFVAGILWWLLDLVDRRVTVRFGTPMWENLGYNSLDTTLVAVTTLTGGIVSAAMGSPWPYFLALVAFKTWFDIWDETKFPRGDHPPVEERGAVTD